MEEAALQQRLDQAFHAIAKVDGQFKEIRTALIGIDGTNGLRGEFRTFAEKMDDRLDRQDEALQKFNDWKGKVEDQWSLYLAKGRQESCIGKAALEEYEAKLEAKLESKKNERRASDETSARLAEINKRYFYGMLSAVLVALISTAGTVYVATRSSNDTTRNVQRSDQGSVENSRP